MMKKLFIILFLLFFLLTSCGKAQGNIEDNNSNSDILATTTQDQENTVENSEPEDEPIVQYDWGYKNYVTSPVPFTIENEVFSMDIPANTPYPTDIEDKILNYCDWVQKASGLSFNPDGKTFDKIKITNVGEDNTTPYVSDINLTNMDYIMDTNFSEDIYLNRLSLLLCNRMVYIDCSPFLSAFMVLNNAKVAKDQGLDYLYNFYMSHNYTFIDTSEEKEIITYDFEKYFRANENGWNDYLYGFRFGVYLETKYGTDILTKIIKGYADKVGYTSTSVDEFVDFLKEQTDEDVFTEFVDWYWDNNDIFEPKDFKIPETGEIIYFVFIHDYVHEGYLILPIDDVATLDFHTSHVYARFKGYKIKGISLSEFSSTKTITIKSYDENKNLLETKTIEPDNIQNLFFENAESLVITGNSSTISFKTVFNESYSK